MSEKSKPQMEYSNAGDSYTPAPKPPERDLRPIKADTRDQGSLRDYCSEGVKWRGSPSVKSIEPRLMKRDGSEKRRK